tara:strand:+ start:1408 stop:1644 length:237 start_codon:yes stop_codon:yes gene_type:complete
VNTKNMIQSIKVQVIFTEPTKYGEFTDALYFSPEEFEAKTQEDLNVLKSERVENFVANIESESTKEVVELPIEEIINN